MKVREFVRRCTGGEKVRFTIIEWDGLSWHMRDTFLGRAFDKHLRYGNEEVDRWTIESCENIEIFIGEQPYENR
jgi:hypothetical protein